MSDKQSLIKKRRELGDQMNTMTANISGTDWTPEQNEAFAKLSDQFDTVDSQLRAIEKAENAQNRLNEYEPVERTPVESGQRNQMNQGEAIVNSEEYEKAFINHLKSQGKSTPEILDRVKNDPGIRNDLRIGADSEGGYLVPTEWERKMDQLLFDNNVMRQVCTVKSYMHDRNVPLVTSVGAAEIVAEGGTYPTNSAAFSNVFLQSFKLGNIEQASEELLNDTPSNLAQDIWTMYSESFGAGEESYFTIGTGSGQPQGVVTAAQVGETAAASAAVTYDELVNLISSVERKYSRNGIFMCNNVTAWTLRKLKDSNGMPIWNAALGLSEDNPETLFGHRLAINEAMPAMTTGNRPIVFGDMKQHVIADRERLSMQVLSELYAGTGKIGFRFKKRIDSRLKRTDAVKALVMA